MELNPNINEPNAYFPILDFLPKKKKKIINHKIKQDVHYMMLAYPELEESA